MYAIMAKNRRRQQVKTLITSNVEAEHMAVDWFTSTIREWLHKDVTGKYLYHDYTLLPDGRMLDKSSYIYDKVLAAEGIGYTNESGVYSSAEMGWFKGPGFYNEADDPILLDSERIESFNTADNYYYLEITKSGGSIW